MHQDNCRESARFSIEPIEPRVLMSFSGGIDPGMVNFPFHVAIVAQIRHFGAPSNWKVMADGQGGEIHPALMKAQARIEAAMVQVQAAIFAPTQLVYSPPQVVFIIYNPQAPSRPAVPPPVIDNPPISDTGNVTSPAGNNVVASNSAPVTPANLAARTSSMRFAGAVNELLSSVQGAATTTAAQAASHTLSGVAEAATSLTSGNLSLSGAAMVYLSMIPDGEFSSQFAMIPLPPQASLEAPVQKMAEAVVEAAATVLPSAQAIHEIAQLGSPLMLLGDSIANFVEESAAIPAAIVQVTGSQTAWAVTFTVLAVDAVLLAYHFHRLRKLRALTQADTYLLPFAQDGSIPKGYEHKL